MTRSELEGIKLVSEQLVTAHSVLRDRYARRAFVIDITILGSTLWLTAMSLVNPVMGVELTPGGLSRDLWLGVLSVVAFFLSIVQIRVDWKGKENAHARACDAYASVKRETVNLLAQEQFDGQEYKRILDKYESAGTMSIPIPESEFNKLKGKHKIKMEISNFLNDRPAASVPLLRFRLWCRDNRWWLHDDGVRRPE